MRKKVTLGLLLAFALFSISATYKSPDTGATGINFFKGSYKEALAEAKKEKISEYGAEWRIKGTATSMRSELQRAR